VGDNERETAWAEVTAVLPTGWVVIPPVYDPAARLWRVYARDVRGAPREYEPRAEADGTDEATALRLLAARFRQSNGDVTA